MNTTKAGQKGVAALQPSPKVAGSAIERKRCAKNQNRSRNGEPQSRHAKGLARGPQEIPCRRKEVLETARQIKPATPQAALGQNRKGLRFRRADWQSDARRFVLRQEPAHYLSLHVWAGLGRRL